MLVTKKGLENRMVELEKEMNIPFEDVGFCITKHHDDIFDLKNAVGDLEEEVNTKFYHVEDDIYELNEFKDSMEYYDLDNMESSINNMEYEFGDMQEKVEELEEKVDDVNYAIDDVKNSIEFDMESMQGKIEELDERIDDIPSMEFIEDELEAHKEHVNNLEWEIEELKDQNKKLMEKIEMLMKVVDVLAVGK